MMGAGTACFLSDVAAFLPEQCGYAMNDRGRMARQGRGRAVK